MEIALCVASSVRIYKKCRYLCEYHVSAVSSASDRPVNNIVRGGSLMVSANPSRERCVVLLGKTLHAHSASLHPGASMSAGEFNTGGEHCDGLTSHLGGCRNTPSRFMLQKLG